MTAPAQPSKQAQHTASSISLMQELVGERLTRLATSGILHGGMEFRIELVEGDFFMVETKLVERTKLK